jgi:hypothetical protein
MTPKLPIIEISGLDLILSASGLKISNVITVSPLRVWALLPTLFPGNPLTYVIRTISKFNSVGFTESKKADRFATYESDLSAIDGHLARFLFEQFSEHVHVVSVNPATHAEHNSVVSTHKSLDS